MPDTTIALLIFLFPLAYSPGPGNMFFAAMGAKFGPRATIGANAGYHVATFAMTAAIGLGFASLVQNAPDLMTFMKWAGSAYVLWLASALWREGVLKDDGKARPAGFGAGAMLLLLNPKAYVIIALMFTQFLPRGMGGADMNGVPQVIWITTVFTLNNLIAFCVWILIGDQIAARFREKTSAKRLNAGFALILAAVAVWMFVA
ncbi:MAG: LysE family translocator [Paracoccaceae bacterium]